MSEGEVVATGSNRSFVVADVVTETTPLRGPESTTKLRSAINDGTSSSDYFGEEPEGRENTLYFLSTASLLESKLFGRKTITSFASFVFIVNNISGPGMLSLSQAFQKGGWTTTVILLVTVSLISAFASTMLCEAMSLVPGNKRYSERLEFATVVRFYFGTVAYYAAQLLYNLSLQVMNIASILDCAQVMDEFVGYLFGSSYALEIYPSFGFIEWSAKGDNTPFTGQGDAIITVGYIIIMAVCMPMGFMNLDENIYFQYLSFAVLVGIIGEFTWEFFDTGLHSSYVPAVGSTVVDNFGVLGTVIFAYTYVVTIPSWCNEKRDDVSVNKSVWSSTLMCTVAYIGFGLLGAMTYPNVSSNLLENISESSHAVTKICVYIFSLGVIALGIPLFSIIIRYNLFGGGMCSDKWAAFWGTVFPWLFAWAFYQGSAFSAFVNWTSLFFNGFINFLIPIAVYLRAKQLERRNKKKLLKDSTDPDTRRYWKEMKFLDDDGVNIHRVFPSFLDRNSIFVFATSWTFGVIIATLILANICFALVYLIFYGEDILS